MTAEKRQGPHLRVVIECAGCKYNQKRYIENEPFDVSVYRVCAHPKRRDDGACPLMPVRKVIGKCEECAHFARTCGKVGLCANDGNPQVVNTLSDFGCIHWEQKP
jgi:hypothetical protein